MAAFILSTYGTLPRHIPITDPAFVLASIRDSAKRTVDLATANLSWSSAPSEDVIRFWLDQWVNNTATLWMQRGVFIRVVYVIESWGVPWRSTDQNPATTFVRVRFIANITSSDFEIYDNFLVTSYMNLSVVELPDLRYPGDNFTIKVTGIRDIAWGAGPAANLTILQILCQGFPSYPLHIRDLGNGTYIIVCSWPSAASDPPYPIEVLAQDQRAILCRAVFPV